MFNSNRNDHWNISNLRPASKAISCWCRQSSCLAYWWHSYCHAHCSFCHYGYWLTSLVFSGYFLPLILPPNSSKMFLCTLFNTLIWYLVYRVMHNENYKKLILTIFTSNKSNKISHDYILTYKLIKNAI